MESRSALLEAIYAEPAEDAPRLVFADWLQERADSWGELIALQYARRAAAPSPEAWRREAALLEDGRPEWLGGLDGICADVRFERGFFASGRVVADSPAVARSAGNAAWSTVEALSVCHNWHTAPANTPIAGLLPRLRGLRRLDVDGGMATPAAWMRVLAPLLERLEFLELGTSGLRTRLARRPADGPLRLEVRFGRAWFQLAKRASEDLVEMLRVLPNDIVMVDVADPRRHAHLTRRELRQLRRVLERFEGLQRLRMPRS